MPLPYQQAAYLKSYGLARQLPKSDIPEIALPGAPTWESPPC